MNKKSKKQQISRDHLVKSGGKDLLGVLLGFCTETAAAVFRALVASFSLAGSAIFDGLDGAAIDTGHAVRTPLPHAGRPFAIEIEPRGQLRSHLPQEVQASDTENGEDLTKKR